MKSELVLLFIVFLKCGSAIRHRDDPEYDKFPSLFDMDSNYEGCLKEPGGVYCVAQFDLIAEPGNNLMNIIRNYSQDQINYYNHSYIQRAVCVSKSCNRFMHDKSFYRIADLNIALEGCINNTVWIQHGLQAKLNNVYYCDKHGDKVIIDGWDWTLGAFLILILAMNLVGSLYEVSIERNDFVKDDRIGSQYLMSFSVFRNWKQLTHIDSDPQADRLKGLHGLKSIATFFIAVSHVLWLVGCGFTDNPWEFEMAYQQFHYQLIFSGMVMVQLFFVISGCLLTFHLQAMSEIKPLTWNIIPKILFFRWIRLTPLNAITVFFTATWLRHLGSGPLWNMYVTTVVNSCRKHWWQHLLYINNYAKEDQFCAVHTWHVSTELQLFTLGLMVFMVSASRWRYHALVLLSAAGMVAPALHVWLQDLDALVLHKPEFYRQFDDDTFRDLHIIGHNNISAHAIGMITGLISYYCVKNKIEYPNSKVLKCFIWCIPLCIVGLLHSGMLFYVNERPHILIRMAYAAIQRPALGVMIAIMILNLVLKSESIIRGILEWRGWVITSRLCYSVYLLHVTFINILQGTRTQLGHISFFYVVITHFGVVSLTILASIPVYLLIEAPLRSISKVFVDGSSSTKEKKQ